MENDAMGEGDQQFYFLDGLQLWAQLELRKQKVRTLQGAYEATDLLVDLRGERPQGFKPKPVFSFPMWSRYQKSA